MVAAEAALVEGRPSVWGMRGNGLEASMPPASQGVIPAPPRTFKNMPTRPPRQSFAPHCLPLLVDSVALLSVACVSCFCSVVLHAYVPDLLAFGWLSCVPRKLPSHGLLIFASGA